MKKYIVTLTKDERETLGTLASKGNHKSQKIRVRRNLFDFLHYTS